MRAPNASGSFLVMLAGVSLGQGPPPEGDAAPASGASGDKGRYTLWNPTPRELRRPLSADRPDATESPYTVDAGAVQLEASFVEYGFDERGGTQTHTVRATPINLKLGLTNSTDFQLLFDPYIHQSGTGPGDPEGVGNLGFRVKQNVYGNDAGRTALAVMPFVLFPSGDNTVASDRVEWGVIVPFAADLGGGWGFGTQVELGRINDGGGGADTEISHTAVFSREITERIGVFAEYIGTGNLDADNYAPSLSGGATYRLDPDTVLDVGVVVGLDDDATEDVTVFMGITKRF